MIQTIPLTPGVSYLHYPDSRFKRGAVSIQLLRPMCMEESAMNALLPAVLLRGTDKCRDLRAITNRLDDLYGASVSTLVRRIGDYQTVGLYLSFVDDRFALSGDKILEPILGFLQETLLDPLLENGAFCVDFVESEKRNLISTIESELNDKRSYAAAKMLRLMCEGDSFAVPRLGNVETVEAITPETLFAHYQKILSTSPVQICYVGSAAPEEVARLLMPLAEKLAQNPITLQDQNAFVPTASGSEAVEQLAVLQSKLCMGFTCGITNRDPDYAAMQVFNCIYGAGMTSKLFLNVRERLSLCYYANSAYYGTKGIVTVSSGIDARHYETARAEILEQLRQCALGNITREELDAAKNALVSSLRSVPDSAGTLEGFYGTAALSGSSWDLPDHIAMIEAVAVEDVARVAATVKLHTVFLLKGVTL